MSIELHPPELIFPAEVELAEAAVEADERRYMVSQWRLMGRRFVRNRAALVGGVVIGILYLTALFANFLAPYSVENRFFQYLYAPPQGIHLLHDRRFEPYIYPIHLTIHPTSLRKVYTVDRSRVIPLHFFVHAEPYRLFGLFPTDIHLFGVEDRSAAVLLLGTDRQGRDMFSRILIGSQISLTVGLLGVFLSLFFGTVIGVASGYF